MSSLQKDPSGNYHICFRFAKKRFKRSLKTKSKKRADAIASQLEERLWLIGAGHLEIPPNVDTGGFLIFGEAKKKPLPSAVTTELPPPPKTKLSMPELFDQYFETVENGSLDAETIKTLKLHRRHLEKNLGKITDTGQLTSRHLQAYINKRAKNKGKFGRPLCGSTIKKELVTLRAVWLWAHELELHDCQVSLRKLKFPKTFELLPFQTRSQIQAQIDQGGLSDTDICELWEALFLTKKEIIEVVDLVKTNATDDFLYPMVAIAAFTGARRAELLRMKINDVQPDRILVRERKRVRGEYSSRFVPTTDAVQATLAEWQQKHPGGIAMFCNCFGKAITKDTAHYQLKRSLAGTDWKCIKGFHTFRHSFISAMAIDGVDQRVIDEIVGHTTDEQRIRYRHLTPNVTLDAVNRVFQMRSSG